jgi:hypothetical protein
MKARAVVTSTAVVLAASLAAIWAALALASTESVASCSIQAPAQQSCYAHGTAKHGPKAIIFNVSETPSQAFKVKYRLSCFDRGGEAHFRQGQFGGSGPYRKVVSIPARFKAQKCYVDAAGSLNDNSGGMKINVKARI